MATVEKPGVEVDWNPKLEELMASEGEKCRGLAWLHNQAEKKYVKLNTYIALPVIALSAIGGFLNASTGSILPQDTSTSGALGAVSVFVGLLNTVGSYFGWAKRSEGHKVANLMYSKLYRFIMIEMSLPRSQRMGARDFLRTIREQMDRLAEISPDIPPDLIDLFNKKFKHENDVKKPEVTNGLEKIIIYDGEDKITIPEATIVDAKTPSGVKISLSV